MKLSKDRLLDFLTDLSLAYELPPLIEEVEEVIEALQNEELEIEGYVRKDHFRGITKMVDEWTKFDSCKVDTYPPKEKFLAWGLPDPDCDGTPTEFFCWRDNYGFSCNESALPEVHFWRPLPPPPGKEEAK